MKYEEAGDPITGTKWIRISTEKIAEILRDSMEISVCKNTVGKLLKEMDFSLKVNKKSVPTKNDPDRDRQFEIIKIQRGKFEAMGAPIISIDTKKRELVGLFKNPGTTWLREAIEVLDHDFRSCAVGVAIPYGIYDVQRNLGYVFVGVSSDTSEFAVNSIMRWWNRHGCKQYRGYKEMLMLADAGGSNSPSRRTWLLGLQEKLCDRYGISLTVCHYPTGASKFNPIERRLYSEITKNWAGRPLDSYETILNYIESTTTKTGLKVRAYFDQEEYEKGIKIPDEKIKALHLLRNEVLGKWNYTIKPRHRQKKCG